MNDARELLQRYLRGRGILGDPEIFLPTGMRSEVLAGLRLSRSPFSGKTLGGSTQASVRKASRGREPFRPSPDVRAPLPPAAPVDDRLASLAASGAADEIRSLPDLSMLRGVVEACSRCALHATRTRAVFADGSANARVACVGEAPGQREDETGLPFVGRAGKLLDRLLISVGLSRREVFICNVLKCRPPGNRNPTPEEIERCSPFLVRQLELVDPEVIVAFGSFAAQTLLGVRDSLRRLRTRVHLYEGYPLVVTYHPAALLRNPAWTRLTWEDLQRVRGLLEGEETYPEPTVELESADGGPAGSGKGRAKPARGRGAEVGGGGDTNLQLSLGDEDG